MGVAGSNPSQKQQNNEIVLLMIDSGSQSTTCCVDFEKDYANRRFREGEAVGHPGLENC